MIKHRQMSAHPNPRHSCRQPSEYLPVNECEEEQQSEARGKSKQQRKAWCWGWLLSGEDKQDDDEIYKICVHIGMSVVSGQYRLPQDYLTGTDMDFQVK
jgi:hypothetical protein